MEEKEKETPERNKIKTNLHLQVVKQFLKKTIIKRLENRNTDNSSKYSSLIL